MSTNYNNLYYICTIKTQIKRNKQPFKNVKLEYFPLYFKFIQVI